jgi:hypothetical protein
MVNEGQTNAGGTRRTDESGKPYYDPAPLSDYPRMLYKKTTVEQTQESADAIADLKDAPMVINRFAGYLCETCIATSATEAEALSELGWDISPQAAHGVTDGLAKTTSAKDDEIAALRAALAQSQAENAQLDPDQPPRRGPGRPPKAPEPA